MIFILYLRGSPILWIKGIILIIYCPSLQKTTQKVVANIRDETLEHVPYIYNNQATSTDTTMHHVITHIQ